MTYFQISELSNSMHSYYGFLNHGKIKYKIVILVYLSVHFIKFGKNVKPKMLNLPSLFWSLSF